jgi:hypothetical protein
MMKIVALLFALIAVLTIRTSEGQSTCIKYWTVGTGGKSGANVFTGITNGTITENYNNPLYYTSATATTNFKTATNLAKGRLSAKLPVSTYKGTMTFDFFSGTVKSQIKILFTKATNKGLIKSGTGCFSTFTAGTAVRALISGTALPKVFEWTFCPKVAATCKPA